MHDTNSKLRVVLYDPSGHGGICHYTYQLAESLVRSGAAVTVLTTEGYELKHLERHFKLKVLFRRSALKNLAENFIRRVLVKILFRTNGQNTNHPTGSPSDQRIRIPAALKKLRLRLLFYKEALAVLFNRPDIVHIQWLMDRQEDYTFINLLKLLGFTVVYTAHDLLPNTNAAPDDHGLLNRIYRKVDAIIVHGKASKDEILSMFDLNPGKIHVIPHGSNDLFCRGKEIPKAAAKTELGISPSRKVILFFGIIKRYKGLEYLVEAFEEIKGRIKNVVLLVAGRLYDTDAEGLRYYSGLIKQIRRRDDVVCVPDYIPFDKIGLYFSAADVVVLPYTKTYTSGILLSAYAAGRPVVATNTGTLAEVVEAGKSGIIVPPKDSNALSLAIEEIIMSPDIDIMGQHAKHLAETKYSWRNVAKKTSELYQSLKLQQLTVGIFRHSPGDTYRFYGDS